MYTAFWDLGLLSSSGDDCHCSNRLFLFFYYKISCYITVHFICMFCNTNYVSLFGSSERECSVAVGSKSHDVHILPASYISHCDGSHIQIKSSTF
jgi:hypothetical protein